jgi:hypothetical protein
MEEMGEEFWRGRARAEEIQAKASWEQSLSALERQFGRKKQWSSWSAVH